MFRHFTDASSHAHTDSASNIAGDGDGDGHSRGTHPDEASASIAFPHCGDCTQRRDCTDNSCYSSRA